MPHTSLDGAHVLLTGASRGFGAVLAAELAGRGARLSLVARDVTALDEVARSVSGHACPADLSDAAALPALVRQVEDTAGPVDILINNAAASWLAPHIEQTAEQVATTIAVNLAAPAELIRLLVPGMLERGRGQIVNVASLGGVIAIPQLAVYGASKSGLIHLTQTLRAELAGSPVRLTLVQLGAVEGTDMYREVMESPMVQRVVNRMGAFGLKMALPPDVVARQVADAVEQGKANCVIPRVATGFHLLRQSPIAIAALVSRSRPSR